MTLSDAIYEGPVLGFGMSGQAGSSLLVLGVLARLQDEAAQTGRKLSTIYAFDRYSSPAIGDLLQRTADHLGIKTVPSCEVPLSEHRRAVDSSSLCWYGADPDLSPYIESELALFNHFQPSLVIGFLRPTLGYSRIIYEQKTTVHLPYMGMGCSLIAGPGSYGVPADFFPPVLAPVADFLGGENQLRDFIIRQVYQTKVTRATKHLYKGFRKFSSSAKVHCLPFNTALFGDLPLILSSPLLSRYRPADSLLVGLMDVRLSFTDIQERRQVAIVTQLKKWQSQEKQIIFVSMGTTGHAFPKVLESLALMTQGEQQVRLLISTTVIGNEAGHLIDQLEQDSVLISSDWLHMNEILPLVDVLVTHGGLNSIESGIYNETPIVVAAPQQMEQGFNGLAIRSQGLGEVVWNYCIDQASAVVSGVLRERASYVQRIRQYKQRHPDCYNDHLQRQSLLLACNKVMRQ